MLNLKAFFFLHIQFTVLCIAHAQPGSDQQLTANHQKEVLYDQLVTTLNPELVNGPEYFVSFSGGATNPFYGSMEVSSNQLWYDNQFYSNVNLLYDIYSDLLILRYKSKTGLFNLIELDQSKVKGFTLHQHRFQKMTSPWPSARKEHGFYDLIYEGKSLMLISKRIKSESQTITQVEYKEDDRYYVIINNHWIYLAAPRILLGLTKDKTKIKAFIKSKKIRLKRMRESDLKEIAIFCDSFIYPLKP